MSVERTLATQVFVVLFFADELETVMRKLLNLDSSLDVFHVLNWHMTIFYVL